MLGSMYISTREGWHLQAAGDHAIHGIAAAASDADDLDAGVPACRHSKPLAIGWAAGRESAAKSIAQDLDAAIDLVTALDKGVGA